MTLKILVADDSATMRKIFEMTFAAEDAEVVTVDSGDAAIAKAREFQPDVVVADASMDGTDGYGVAQALKGAGGSPPAVLVMASQHTSYDADKGKAAGVDDHILKPFDTATLIDKLRSSAGKPRAAAQPGAAAAAAPPKPPAPPPPPAAAKPAASPTGQPAPGSTGSKLGKSTMSYGPPQKGAPAKPAAPAAAAPASPARPASPAPSQGKPAAPAPRKQTMDIEAPSKAPAAKPASAPAATSGATADEVAGSGMAEKLQGMGLTKEQVEGVLALTSEVIEQVVWEVVPDLAETLIKEEIRRLTQE